MHGHDPYYVIANRMQLHMRILVVTLDVYSARFAQHHHTALGWIACKCAEGFARVLQLLHHFVKTSIHFQFSRETQLEFSGLCCQLSAVNVTNCNVHLPI